MQPDSVVDFYCKRCITLTEHERVTSGSPETDKGRRFHLLIVDTRLVDTPGAVTVACVDGERSAVVDPVCSTQLQGGSCPTICGLQYLWRRTENVVKTKRSRK